MVLGFQMQVKTLSRKVSNSGETGGRCLVQADDLALAGTGRQQGEATKRIRETRGAGLGSDKKS